MGRKEGSTHGCAPISLSEKCMSIVIIFRYSVESLLWWLRSLDATLGKNKKGNNIASVWMGVPLDLFATGRDLRHSWWDLAK